MPNYETSEMNSVEEVRDYAAQGQGTILVLAPEILQQIEAAEAAGGYEGGMTGSSDGAGYSAAGSGALDSSSATDPPPVDWSIQGATPAGVLIEGAVEKILDFKDLFEAFKGQPLGPVILVPKRELDRWLYGTTDGA